MKINEYVNAVDKLRFTDDLLGRVRKAAPPKPRLRLARLAAMAAVLLLLMATSVFGVVTAMRERRGDLVELGTDKEIMTDAEIMNFKVSADMEGVQVHYMELEGEQQYSFRHGMLWTGSCYQRVTDDYTLVPQTLNRVDGTLEKNGRVYRLRFDYLETQRGIISNHRSIYQKDANHEILLCGTDGRSGQWPICLNVQTGEIRDALPDWTAEDFQGRIGYADPLRGGILISTIVEDSESTLSGEKNNQPGRAYSLLYWIAPGSKTAKKIEIPHSSMTHVENDTVYYQDTSGRLFAMDEEFQFHQISDYTRTNPMQDGLMTVSVSGKLGIVDAFSGDTYVFDEIAVQPWDIGDYNAIRYGNTGTIALVQTQWLHEPERVVLVRLGILNEETGELKLLNIEKDYDGYQHSWLDENRFAVVYRNAGRQFLCVYEFEK